MPLHVKQTEDNVLFYLKVIRPVYINVNGWENMAEMNIVILRIIFQ